MYDLLHDNRHSEERRWLLGRDLHRGAMLYYCAGTDIHAAFVHTANVSTDASIHAAFVHTTDIPTGANIHAAFVHTASVSTGANIHAAFVHSPDIPTGADIHAADLHSTSVSALVLAACRGGLCRRKLQLRGLGTAWRMHGGSRRLHAKPMLPVVRRYLRTH